MEIGDYGRRLFKPITKAGANRRLMQLAKPAEKTASEFRLSLALLGESPDFSCARFVYDVCVGTAWNCDYFGESRAEQLRDVVCRAVASGVVDFSDREIDSAFAMVLPEIVMAEFGEKSETASLFEALICYAPETSQAREMALRLNHAFGFTLCGYFLSGMAAG